MRSTRASSGQGMRGWAAAVAIVIGATVTIAMSGGIAAQSPDGGFNTTSPNSSTTINLKALYDHCCEVVGGLKCGGNATILFPNGSDDDSSGGEKFIQFVSCLKGTAQNAKGCCAARMELDLG